MSNTKKIPLRRCIATNEQFPKQLLIRVVKDNTGKVFIDETGRANGRGAYISKSMDALNKAKKTNCLARALETSIDPSIYDELEKIINK